MMTSRKDAYDEEKSYFVNLSGLTLFYRERGLLTTPCASPKVPHQPPSVKLLEEEEDVWGSRVVTTLSINYELNIEEHLCVLPDASSFNANLVKLL